jgi:phosphoglycerol transferase MdoB-like AlkP superfamily enzyme
MILFKKLLKYYIYFIGIFFIGRLGLFILYFDRFSSVDINYFLTFLYGLKMDTMAVSILLLLPMFLLTLMPKSFSNFVNIFLKYYFLVLLGVAIYMEIATYPFVAQYDARPNFLFVEYLQYPKEVFSMIFADYKKELLFAFVVISSFVVWYLKTYKDDFLEAFDMPYFKRLLLFLPLLILLFIGIRSSFGHRPANISDAMISSNRILNEITKNTIYSVSYAIYVNSKSKAKDIAKRYGKIDLNEAIRRVQKRLDIRNADKKYFLTRFEPTNFPQKETKNIVIFLQESLGAQFVAATGGKNPNITPNMNALAKQGILFTNLYSNGTRSIRGIGGTTSGIFSIPGKGVVKRNKSQRDFFTFSQLLKPRGYHTSFIYGGESRFDNMKGWFLGNGFDEVIDQDKFKNPKFVGTWGVCDEEVVARANEEFKKLYAKKQKFATIMFSTSNHTPFDFPDGRIKLLDGVKKKNVLNAVKYADFSIGKFIELARKEDYYKDTIFVIIADHNVRVYGNDIVPVNMFQIPAVILGANVKPLVYDKIATQPDILATILDLAGIEGNVPIMGHSIFSDKKQNLSFMQFNDRYALRVDDTIAVVTPNQKPQTFIYKNKHLVQTQHNKELEKDLIAFITVLNKVYQDRIFKGIKI